MTPWFAPNRRLAAHPLVQSLAAAEGAEISVSKWPPDRDGEAIGWGHKPSGGWALGLADRGRVAGFRLFEDGFIRSLKPGYDSGALYGIVQDRSGIYYDAEGRSDLVDFLKNPSLPRDSEAEALLERFRACGASKYNWFTDREEDLEAAMPDSGVLVVDQTRDDASLKSARLGPAHFEKALEAALSENPAQPVYVRTHPDVVEGRRPSCFGKSPLLQDGRVHLTAAPLRPARVFERVEKVYAVGSLLGLEAILHGKKVVHFGRSFYGGWGLTDDRHPEMEPRGRKLSPVELFHACYGQYTRYFDPDTGQPCSLKRILNHLELQFRFHRENSGTWNVNGLDPWKRRVVPAYLASPSAKFVERPVENARSVRWSVGTEPAGLCAEDGFIRSAGLGAAFNFPLSLVFDSEGMYFDATRPSRIEKLLATHTYTDKERETGRRIIQSILERRVTKYNLRANPEKIAAWEDLPRGRRILVPGQVESDASLKYGYPLFRKNTEFLREVRRQNPDAIIAYKPHPDLVRNLRPGAAATAEIQENCDILVRDLDLLPWLDGCDELHTLTSLSGFEALLRRKSVTCYGVPFYAGWGLSHDLVPVPDRRKRNLRLEELVFSALVQYPRYLNPFTEEFTSIFAVLDLLDTREGELSSRSPSWLKPVAFVKQVLNRFLR